MTLDNKNVYLEDISADLFHKSSKIGEKTVGNNNFVVRYDGEMPVGNEVIDKCFGALSKAFSVEQQLYGGEVRNFYWSGKDIDLILKDKMSGAMNNAFGIKTIFAISKSEETLGAAMIHEIIEMWREDQGLIGEGAQLMAEYLFCGEDRKLFNDLVDDFGKDGDSYQTGWNKVVRALGFEGGDKENLRKSLLDWKKSLSEGDKIVFIKEKLLRWDQNAEGKNDIGN